MAELKKHAFLLSILAVLLVAKFVLLPVIEWQDAMIADIQLLEKKSQKVARVISGESNTNEINLLLSEEVAKGNKLFYPHQAQSKFKLQQQKLIESLLAEHRLKSQNIGWQTPSELTFIQVDKHPLQLRFSGKTLDVMKFIAAIEKLEKKIEVSDFNLSLKKQNENSLGRCDGRLTVNFYVNSTAQNIKHQGAL